MGAAIQKTYTPEQVERALQQLALTGSAPATSDILASTETDPLEIPAGTLRHWRAVSHRDRFEQIRRDHTTKIEQTVASRLEDTILAELDLGDELLEQITADIDKLKPGEKAALYKVLTVSRAVNVDKRQLLRDRPTQIVQYQDATEILDSLALSAPGVVVEGTVVESTADEISDADVVPEPPA